MGFELWPLVKEREALGITVVVRVIERIQYKSFSLVLGDGSGIAKNGVPTGAPHEGKHNIILDTVELLCSIAASQYGQFYVSTFFGGGHSMSG